jgi:hypothetical protein
MPDMSEILQFPENAAFTLSNYPAAILFPYDIDIDVGYLVEVYRPIVLDGARVPVATTLSADAAQGAVSLHVRDTLGFTSGSEIKIGSGLGTAQWTKVHLVADEHHLTLYPEVGLKEAAPKGTPITISDFYQIVSIRTPRGVRPATECSAVRLVHHPVA